MDGPDLLISCGNSRDGVVDISSGGGGLWNLKKKKRLLVMLSCVCAISWCLIETESLWDFLMWLNVSTTMQHFSQKEKKQPDKCLCSSRIFLCSALVELVCL